MQNNNLCYLCNRILKERQIMAEKKERKKPIQFLYIIYPPDNQDPITTKKKGDIINYFGEKYTSAIRIWFKHSGCWWRCLHKGIEVRRHIIPKMSSKAINKGEHLKYKRT